VHRPKTGRNESARCVGPVTNISSSMTIQMLSGQKRAASVVTAFPIIKESSLSNVAFSWLLPPMLFFTAKVCGIL